MIKINSHNNIVKTLFFISALLYFNLCSASHPGTTTKKSSLQIYTVGIVPQFEARKLYGIWRPILDQLENDTGLKFKFKSARSIAEFEKQLIAGQYDFSYMNSFQPILTQKTQGYIPLVRDHSNKLQGILVVRKDSHITNINQLNNTTIAFPAPNALAASLMLRAELINQHINFTPSYVNTHDSVYLNVIYKKVAAGGGVDKTFNWQQPSVKNKLRIIYRTKTSSPHLLAVHPRIDKSIAKKVQQALIEMSNTNKGRKLLSKIPIKEIGLATIEDYEPLRDMGLEKILNLEH